MQENTKTNKYGCILFYGKKKKSLNSVLDFLRTINKHEDKETCEQYILFLFCAKHTLYNIYLY